MAEDNPEVLVMTIEVRPGVQDMLSVHRYDNPHTLA
jgi:hypothetical protein